MTMLVQWETSGQCGVFLVPYVLVLALLPQEHIVHWMFKPMLSPTKQALNISTADLLCQMCSEENSLTVNI